MVGNILENFISQNYQKKELIIILNYDNADLDDFTASNIHIYNLGSSYSLGNCINYGIGKSNYPIIAKFDDDDYYGPHYLSHTIESLSLKDVAIVGKSCYFVYFAEKQIIGVNNACKENKYVNRVAGSTLMFRKSLMDQISFSDISLGEDIHFCNDCASIGYKIFSTNRYHYAYIRNNNNKHTWKIDNEYILGRCTEIHKTKDLKEYIANSVNKGKKTYL